MRLWLLLCIYMLATGCSVKAIYNPEPEWPWKSNSVCTVKVETPNDCTLTDVVTAYNLALNYCIDYSNMYEDGGDTINNSRFAIATLGTLSGAVFAPLAGGSAKDAWSGLSGSTNALQSSLNESFNNAINIRRRLEITGAGTTAKQQVSEGKDHLNKVLASMQLAYECRMAAARADGAAIQALSNLQGGAVAVPSDRTAAEVNPEAAKEEAEKRAKGAADVAAQKVAEDAPPIIPPGATLADKAAIKAAQGEITTAVTSAAATAAATAATDAAQQVPAAPGETPTIQQTQVTAQVAAQVAAGSAAQTAADAKVAELIKGAPSDLAKQVIMQMAAPTVDAAVSAAASAAAASATTPMQPLDGLK